MSRLSLGLRRGLAATVTSHVVVSRIVVGFVAVCLAFLAFSTTARAQSTADPLSAAERDRLYDLLQREAETVERHVRVLKTVITLVRPTVVHIEANKIVREGRGPRSMTEESGSGVVFEHVGRFYVLTNRHVIKGADPKRIAIELVDGRTITPLTVLSDSGTDVAVMSIDAPRLIPARLGDSRVVEIGDLVIAVGSPFGLSQSVTYGIVSAMGRRDLELGDSDVQIQDFLQTDAAINPGNSGGPLINLRGEIIGLNTAIASNSGGSEGIGFAIPINMAVSIARQLIDKGRVVRAYLGVRLDRELTAEMAETLGMSQPRGALVRGVTPDSPAARAPLLPNDVILTFDGTSIEDDTHLINQVKLTEVGREVPISVLRRGSTITILVRVGDLSAFEPEG